MHTPPKRNFLLTGSLICSAAAGLLFVRAQAQKDPNKPVAQISPLAAISAATKIVPGRALMANLEFDEGHWIYGVIIVDAKKKLSEVDIDPITGKVIGKPESLTPEAEGKEMTDMLKAAIK